jgi:hypothetical protein
MTLHYTLKTFRLGHTSDIHLVTNSKNRNSNLGSNRKLLFLGLKQQLLQFVTFGKGAVNAEFLAHRFLSSLICLYLNSQVSILLSVRVA